MPRHAPTVLLVVLLGASLVANGYLLVSNDKASSTETQERDEATSPKLRYLQSQLALAEKAVVQVSDQNAELQRQLTIAQLVQERNDIRFAFEKSKLDERFEYPASSRLRLLDVERELEELGHDTEKAIAVPDRLPIEDDPEDTLEGRVRFTGELPKLQDFTERMRQHPDAKELFKAASEHRLDPTWRIDPKTKGVANVFVFVKRPDDGILPIHPKDKVRKEPVVIETPFAAFVPHATAYYPEWFDGKERGKTGQELIFLNSDKLLHNVRATSSNKDFQGFNAIVMPRTQLNPSKQFKKSSQHVTPHRLPYMISNSIYSWMSANVWCFDHPYFAITKTDGSFRIPRVPAGMEVQVMAWHESQGWLFTKEGKTMTLKKGKNVLDFEMSAK